jgi:chromosome segregation ATPase
MLPYRRPLERLSNLEQRMRAMDPQLALNLDGLRGLVVPIDERITAMEREIAALKQQERKINDELTRTEASIFRAKAKQSRATVVDDGTPPRSSKR